MTVEISKKIVIRITSRQLTHFKINSDNDDKELIELFNNDKIEIDDKDKDEAEKEIKIKKNYILAAGRLLRNIVFFFIKYRDSQIRFNAKSSIQKFKLNIKFIKFVEFKYFEIF